MLPIQQHQVTGFLPVNTNAGLFHFNTQDIIRLEASSNYTLIHFLNRRPLLVAKVLGDYEQMLASQGFVRTHKSHLVNKRHIRFIDPSNQIIMLDRSKAEISRRKKKEVMNALCGTGTVTKLAA